MSRELPRVWSFREYRWHEVPCPSCKAVPGSACKSKNKRADGTFAHVVPAVVDPHLQRLDLARRQKVNDWIAACDRQLEEHGGEERRPVSREAFDEVVSVLAEYGQHRPWCSSLRMGSHPCNCGYVDEMRRVGCLR